VRELIALTFAIATTGCFSWRPYEPAAPLTEASSLPYRLRATLADSSRVDLTAPFVQADSLYGRSGGPKRDTLALSVADVRRLEHQRFNIWRTLGAVLAPPAALVGVAVVVCSVESCAAQY
jgi:hypothetical protein